MSRASWRKPRSYHFSRARPIRARIGDYIETGVGEYAGGACSSASAGTTIRAGFVYVRLHGSRVLYGSDYTDEKLAAWASRIRKWSAEGRDVYVYFDNDHLAYAPHDALEVARQVRQATIP